MKKILSTARSFYVRVAHELVVKGYARPAFGGTSRRRSIMKTHQLSWWVTFFSMNAAVSGFFHDRIKFGFQKNPTGGIAARWVFVGK